MMISPFTSGNLPMPQWAYVPGETGEADADDEADWVEIGAASRT
ncbi:MAG: hypothetical protein WBF73_10480 [Bradyrhizobium sp.]|jgi:hypothetical protein